MLTAYDGENDEWPRIGPEYETLDGEDSTTSRSDVVSLKPLGRRKAVRSPSAHEGFEAIQSQQSSIANEASSSSTSSDDDSTQSEGSTEYSQEEDIAPETEEYYITAASARGSTASAIYNVASYVLIGHGWNPT